jgi:hypothetical protein
MNRRSCCLPGVGVARSAKWWQALGVCALLNAQPVIAQPSEFPPLGTIDFYGLTEISEDDDEGSRDSTLARAMALIDQRNPR